MEPGLHVGVLYASPLGYYEDGVFKVLEPLSYVSEIESIEATLQPGNSCVADFDLRFSHNVGTPSNFMTVAGQNARVLHFICHGVVSKARVCSLVLQNVDGSGAFITTQSLNKMLEISKAKLDIVFLSACHSEGAAQAFLESGASHVICIKKEN